jgi:hypothetical protein
MQKERIAIIGVRCWFPGGVSSKDSLWRLLVEGREEIIEHGPASSIASRRLQEMFSSRTLRDDRAAVFS